MAGIITIGAASSTDEVFGRTMKTLAHQATFGGAIELGSKLPELLGEDRENLLPKVPGDEPGDSEIPIFQCWKNSGSVPEKNLLFIGSNTT